MSFTKTTVCIICLKPDPVIFGGHVHKEDGSTVVTGFHRECDRDSTDKNCKGCFGKWAPEMGESEPFGQVGYIDSDGFHEEE
jgi:hypothetical protein